jgi:hypothetical protein
MPFTAPNRLLLLATLVAAAVLLGVTAAAQQSGTITLIGTVSQNCSLQITPTAAATNLDLSGGNKRIEVGTALQNCNKKSGYTLQVLSQNCAAGTLGAKFIGTVAGESLNYSVEFNNPPTGGSQTTVTDLLATACSGATAVTGRDVTNEKINNEISRIYVNYSGNSGLASDSYTDTLTVVLVLK